MDVFCSFCFLGVPPPTLVGKVGGPPTLTKIEKVGGIRGVSEKSQLFYVFKTPFRGRPPPIVLSYGGGLCLFVGNPPKFGENPPLAV